MNQDDLTVGVLGGMGPEATIDFMSLVVALSGATNDQDHIHLIVDQNPKVPNRQQALRGEGPNPGAVLATMARRLEQAGADFLVMPCNTAHAFTAAIREAVKIPLISIIDVTVDEIGVACPLALEVGIMATDGMLQAGLLQNALAESGRKAVLPTGDELGQLMDLIHGIKAGDKSSASRHAMAALAKALELRGAEVVIAACTEIPLLLRQSDLTVPLISTTEVLARRTVSLARRALPLYATN
ncbi:MAG TPA: amino acid racemase [Woeseiaceae bacterium]